MAAGRKLAVTAACFSVAAAVSCWSPLAAPFGLVVGLAALFMAIRALRLGGRRLLAGAAAVVAVLSIAGSAVVLALTAGVGRDPGGQPVVSGSTGDEAARILDREEQRTRGARERARDELGKVGGAPDPGPRKDAKR